MHSGHGSCPICFFNRSRILAIIEPELLFGARSLQNDMRCAQFVFPPFGTIDVLGSMVLHGRSPSLATAKGSEASNLRSEAWGLGLVQPAKQHTYEIRTLWQ